jgi:hypothetical protein
MEDWELEFEWLKIRHFVKKSFRKESLPDMEAMLFAIGIQETNLNKAKYTKEEKQDLMHVATCHLLSFRGYYEFIGQDDEGWPHFRQIKRIHVSGLDAQERMLKECMIHYFSKYTDIISDHED